MAPTNMAPPFRGGTITKTTQALIWLLLVLFPCSRILLVGTAPQWTAIGISTWGHLPKWQLRRPRSQRILMTGFSALTIHGGNRKLLMAHILLPAFIEWELQIALMDHDAYLLQVRCGWWLVSFDLATQLHSWKLVMVAAWNAHVRRQSVHWFLMWLLHVFLLLRLEFFLVQPSVSGQMKWMSWLKELQLLWSYLFPLGFSYFCTGIQLLLHWGLDTFALGFSYFCTGVQLLWTGVQLLLRWVSVTFALGFSYFCYVFFIFWWKNYIWLKVWVKFSIKVSSQIESLGETFNQSFNPDWKFDWNFQWNFQPSPWKFQGKVSRCLKV